jgi:threonine dehydratase
MVTPLEQQKKLAEVIGFSDLYFKREDLHPYGSHKGRSIPVMIDHYVASGDTTFAISSSGNAALAAAMHMLKLNTGSATPLSLDIFVGNHVSPSKLKRIKAVAEKSAGAIRILAKERPLQALTQATNDGARSLRQSTDDEALVGYESLAEELVADAQTKKITSIFVGTSSGTTAQALAAYFHKHASPIQVHIVQTSSCHPLSDAFEAYDGPDERSTADAITDITGHRKSALIPCIEKTGGRGWIATNDDIKAAMELVQENSELTISTNSALSIVGAMKAAYTSYEIDGAVVCMICGE